MMFKNSKTVCFTNEELHKKIVRTIFIDVQNVKYVPDTYFCSNFNKIEN